MKSITAAAAFVLLATQTLANLEHPSCVVRTVYTTITVDESGAWANGYPTKYQPGIGQWDSATPISKSPYVTSSGVAVGVDDSDYDREYGHGYGKPTTKPGWGSDDEDDAEDDDSTGHSHGQSYSKPTGKPTGYASSAKSTASSAVSKGSYASVSKSSQAPSSKSSYGSITKSPHASSSKTASPSASSSSIPDFEWTGEWDVECAKAGGKLKARSPMPAPAPHAKGYVGAHVILKSF